MFLFISLHLYIANTSLQLMTGPESLAAIEESMGWKFISTQEYKDIKDEIAEHSRAIAEMIKWGLDVHSLDLEEKMREIGHLKKEHDNIVAKLGRHSL